jgi:hypothetical protein
MPWEPVALVRAAGTIRGPHFRLPAALIRTAGNAINAEIIDIRSGGLEDPPDTRGDEPLHLRVSPEVRRDDGSSTDAHSVAPAVSEPSR